MADKKEKKTITTKDNSLSSSSSSFTKSDFMSALKKVSRRLTDVPSDRHPGKPEPTK